MINDEDGNTFPSYSDEAMNRSVVRNKCEYHEFSNGVKAFSGALAE